MASPQPEDAGILARKCSVGRAVSILSDTWTFLVLREMYLGARQFEPIRLALQLPRTTLSERLGRLVQHGIVERRPYMQRPLRHEYRLTAMGLDLYLVMLALLRFGDDFLSGSEPPPLDLIHAPCGHRCHPTSACSACGEDLFIGDVTYRDGSGAGLELFDLARRARRSSDPSQFERGRPSSVSRALQVIGDRWSFLVLREAFFGARRFDEIQARLAIASNILADRLNRLVEDGVFDRVRYQEQPPRYEYRLTPMGRALYLPMIEMLRWGDRWLGDGNPPLILSHRNCGQDMLPSLVCSHCRMPLTAYDVRYRLNYNPPGGATVPPAAVTGPVRY